mgnify:CR=1 FL=1
MKRNVLDLEKFLPPVALLKMQQLLRAMVKGESLEIRLNSTELLGDVERLLSTSGTSFRSEKIRGGKVAHPH